MVARVGHQIHRFQMTLRALFTDPPPKERGGKRRSKQRAHDVSSRVQIVYGYDELVEPRLVKILCE